MTRFASVLVVAGSCTGGPVEPGSIGDASIDTGGTQGDAAIEGGADAGPPVSVLYVGDSIAAEMENTVRFAMASVRPVTFDALVAQPAGICDFLDGRPGVSTANSLRARVETDAPDIVIFQFWGDATSPCMTAQLDSGTDSSAYFARYQADALSAVQAVQEGAGKAVIARPRILWVLQGPDAASATRAEQLDAVYQYVASLTDDRVSNAGFAVSLAADPSGSDAQNPRYAWTQYLPCSDVERQNGYCTRPQSFGGTAQIHPDDDNVHFCLGDESTFAALVACAGVTKSPGVLRYGMQIANDAVAWLSSM